MCAKKESDTCYNYLKTIEVVTSYIFGQVIALCVLDSTRIYLGDNFFYARDWVI